jgi:hypothetical protein
MGRPRKDVFIPESATKDALRASRSMYDAFLANISKGIDEDATGSDRLNELKAISYAVNELPNLIKGINTLQKMIEQKDYDKERDIVEGESEKFM